MKIKSKIAVSVLAAAGFMASSLANAYTISTFGSVSALTDISQMGSITGSVDFEGAPAGSTVGANDYAGITFHQDNLSNILSGVTTSGSSTRPLRIDNSQYFTQPILGGGSYSGLGNYFAGVVTFDQAVTQFGLTASRNGNQYLTVWDTSGVMLGQVNWEPSFDSSFIGIDTGGVAIGMLAYGNDDLWNGATYGVSGATIMSDNWVWSGDSIQVDEPMIALMFGLALAGVGVSRRRG